MLGSRAAADPSRPSKSGQRLPIDLDAQSRPIRHSDDAASVLDELGENRLPERVFGSVELQQRRDGYGRGPRVQRQNGKQMQRRGNCKPGAPNMRIVTDAERFCHIGDLLAFGQTAGRANVGLRYIERARDEHVAEPEARELTFSACDRDRNRPLYRAGGRQDPLALPAPQTSRYPYFSIIRPRRIAATLSKAWFASTISDTVDPTASRTTRVAAASSSTPKPTLSFTAENPSAT